MNCNSCHIGTYYIVPNFTRTGRLFAMRGYQVPYVRERLHAEGDTGNNNEQSKYGGDYLALNWTSAADRGPHTWYAAATILTMTQNFESGVKVEDTQWGAYLRYFYARTYGAEVFVRDHLKYEYTTPARLKRDTYTKPDYGITFLWYPAMNFDLWLSFSPRIQNIVFEDQRERYSDKASSYVLGMEYNF